MDTLYYIVATVAILLSAAYKIFMLGYKLGKENSHS